MRGNSSAGDWILIFVSFTLGLALLLVSIYYWDILDILVYPNIDDTWEQYKYSLDPVVPLVPPINDTILDFLIPVTGYNFLMPIEVLLIIVTCFSVFHMYKRSNARFSMLPAFICFIFFILFVLNNSIITKSNVDAAFAENKDKDITGMNLIVMLRNEKYDELDSVLHDIEMKFKSGDVSESQYAYEYRKLYKAIESDLHYFDQWIPVSSHPEYPLMIRGLMLKNLGWIARGTRFSKDTSNEQYSLMNDFFDRAQKDHERALSINPRSLFSYSSLIDMSRSRVNIDGSEIYKKAKSVFPDSYIIKYRYIFASEPRWGGSYKEMREFAVEQRSHAVNGPTLIALSGYEASYRASLHWSDKEYDEAIRWYKRALLYGPREKIYKRISDLYKTKDDFVGAINILTEGLSFQPDNRIFLTRRATYLVQNKELLKAEQDVLAATKTPIYDYWLLSRVAWVLETTNYEKRAVEFYKKSLEQNPAYKYAVDALYRLSYNGVDSYEAVLPYMKRYTEIVPDDYKGWIYYADTIEDLDQKKSIPAYERYLELVDRSDPKNQVAIKNVERLLKEISDKK